MIDKKSDKSDTNPGEETVKTRRRYDRIARFYDLMEWLVETSLFKNFRGDTIKNLQGNILEVGVGTGKNLPYYNPKAKITAIDISPRMLDKAKKRAGKIKRKVEFHLMDAQGLKFKENSFDYIVGTFILCSIPDPVKALEEMRRVLKKDGQIIFIEHVLSENKLIAALEHIHNPVTKTLFGFNVNRDTKENIIKAGLKINRDEKLALHDVFRKFTCSKN